MLWDAFPQKITSARGSRGVKNGDRSIRLPERNPKRGSRVFADFLASRLADFRGENPRSAKKALRTHADATLRGLALLVATSSERAYARASSPIGFQGGPPDPPMRRRLIMDRLPGFEQPYETLPTSYRARAKAGATHHATGDHWEPQNAHPSQNLRRIQSIRGHQREDTAVLLRQASPFMTTLSPRSPPIWS